MKIIVLGAGESGVGAALLAQQKGHDVFVSDGGVIKDHFLKELIDNKIVHESGVHTEAKILEAELVIKSPGIPDAAPLVKKIAAQGIPIISEIEWAARHTTAKIIAITGSNGKTTTTNLTYHLLKTAGFKVGVAGNVGYSFARKVATETHDWYVLEISSFQLDGCFGFKPNIAVLLNITPDHLDRYDYDLAKYVASKFRITQNQDKNDHFIYNTEDKNMKKWLRGKNIAAERHKVFPSALLPDGDSDDTDIELMGFEFEESDLTIRGAHNLFNASCAIIAAKLAGVKNKYLLDGLTTFVNAPHRLQEVATINGVDFINDSKATNVDSVFYALQAMTKPIIWIAGGTDKGNDYSPLDELAATKVKALICMGVDNDKLTAHYSPIIKVVESTHTLADAVALAVKYAEEGDIILLSPACASFDLFKNYEDRGDKFMELVRSLA